MNTCQFSGGARAVTIREWIPAMFWTSSCFQLAFTLLSNSLLEHLHRSKASSHYWFLKLVPFGTSCTSADFYKQNILTSFVEIWKESPIPHCWYFGKKYTAIFSSTWQCKVFVSSGGDSGFLHMILVWVSFQTVFPCYLMVSQFWNNQKDLSCQTDLFLCWNTNEIKWAQAKSFHN